MIITEAISNKISGRTVIIGFCTHFIETSRLQLSLWSNFFVYDAVMKHLCHQMVS